MISVILINPENAGNIGAIARSMKNFGLNDLIVIDPKGKVNTVTARKRAMHAEDLIRKAKVKDMNHLKKFDYLVATTAKIGSDYNIPRSPISPEQLAKRIHGKRSLKIGIVFGRESKGLTNEEIALCDFVVTIPTSKKYPSLNLSHAAAILFYELFKADAIETISSHIIFASQPEKEQIIKYLNQVLDNMDFSTPEKRKTQDVIWKKLIGKSFLTKREAYALIGFFKKMI